MSKRLIPESLVSLHRGEEFLRRKSIEAIQANTKLLLHIEIVECAMDVLDALRTYPTDDEDLKVIQVLGMRQFNALASATKLMLSGYNQTSALILRDVMETVFLLDYFRTERSAIAKWRIADKATRLRDFKPVKIREALDKRDGFTSKKRAEFYELFSELAGHASMKGIGMLKPHGMDAQIGPFFDVTALAATVGEMGRLAVQVGENTGAFLPLDWPEGQPFFQAFTQTKLRWYAEFYPRIAKKYQQ
ncbi:hypothetical protein [Filomicrobium sp.]|uniref:hypothetical protein n=1 Tax=Filomicrobium sp. TaxID=2024831 RepID=UPI0025887831|nr:hypothetical protein [Filomicrobium sp.]MCV0371843.1 hypothetical protein [Filomicrobium sp.]